MKRSNFLSIIAIGLIAAISVRRSFIDVLDFAVSTYRTCRDWIVKIVLAPIAMCAERAGFIARKPAVLLIAARSFFARCVRRAQPRVESQWRLCASA